MRITYASRCCETGERLEESLEGSDMKDKKIVLNIGDSSFNEAEYVLSGYDIINRVEDIKRCVDKKRMFKELAKGNVKCLDFMDLKTINGVLKAVLLIQCSKRLVLRIEGRRKYKCISTLKELLDNLRECDYATAYEEKINEWRVLCYRGQVLRVWDKEPDDDNVRFWHRSNCTFNSSDNIEVGRLGLEASRALGIDLSGVDVLENDRHELKVIEVNSGMAMSYGTIKRLFNKIKEV
jgi:hypothetical protein